ncbi:probable E3 SUMO-protein ligase RNF212 [Hyla sarda]|uniref:probable E3 SUMO-protein ligase RNF212 n=1 Tax=Hyla sarda TaxID=327740 RepID=UPI0024C427A4|nr:probable E3 SUMO-protein ligase RNF212 [Hyla sarda]XP_056427794.1 probable E3 SUMO-protein ligase RNF212 [Hyla sarda]XP_056427795.1 probable E3 SUMO-protein ligase RNF212 [Hyla sarda]XP_056427796.1 probable E3 SUMO-protein ligase RNF212 [Hyla sarda]XP_056427797.1 probable E3 SUMO-protein ligase RNF212 [Hyla sarda]
MCDLQRCNICFRQPGRETSRSAISSCGHVFCERCLQKGRKGECGVCKVPCRTIFLTDETDPEIKMLFMDINVLCKTFSSELTQVIEFQESHRHRILAHYKRKIAKLEETIKELIQQLQSLRASPSYSRLSACNTLRNMDSIHSDKYSPSLSQVSSTRKYDVPRSQTQTSNTVQSMDITSNAPRKNFTIAGPNRLSLISPPSSGLTGSYRNNPKGGSVRSVVGSSQSNVFRPFSQSISPINPASIWHSSSQRSPQVLPQTPLSSQPPSARQPITLANILQRRH